MDITGSIADATAPLSTDLTGSLGAGTGSSFIDTMTFVVTSLPRYLLQFAADVGADLGSTMGGPTP